MTDLLFMINPTVMCLVSRPMRHNLTHGVAELRRLLDGGGTFKLTQMLIEAGHSGENDASYHFINVYSSLKTKLFGNKV